MVMFTPSLSLSRLAWVSVLPSCMELMMMVVMVMTMSPGHWRSFSIICPISQYCCPPFDHFFVLTILLLSPFAGHYCSAALIPTPPFAQKARCRAWQQCAAAPLCVFSAVFSCVYSSGKLDAHNHNCTCIVPSAKQPLYKGNIILGAWALFCSWPGIGLPPPCLSKDLLVFSIALTLLT